LRVPGGIGGTVRHDVHKMRREALSPFFSKRNVLHLEPMIAKKVEQLCRLIGKYAAEGMPVNLSDVFFAFSNEYVPDLLAWLERNAK
jgi:cytochrome P450